MVDVSDIFKFFSARGGGKGESETPGGVGDWFFLKIPGGGGGPGGAEGPGGCLRRIRNFFGVGGLNFFFSGPKCPPRNQQCAY